MLELEKQRGASANDLAMGGDRPVLRRFLRLYTDYSKERTYSKEWADSYSLICRAAAVHRPRLWR